MSKTQSEEAIRKILIIDIENRPAEISNVLDYIKQYDQVLICFARSGSKIPLDDLLIWVTLLNNKKLKVVRSELLVKNAADFAIAFHLGILAANKEVKYHFTIMSSDKALECLKALVKPTKHILEII